MGVGFCMLFWEEGVGEEIRVLRAESVGKR